MLKFILVAVLLAIVAGAFVFWRRSKLNRRGPAAADALLDLRSPRPSLMPDEPGDRCELVLKPLWDPLKAVGYERDEQVRFLNRLTRGQQLVFYAWILDGQVSNGGWSAVYYNSTGDFAPEIRGALRELGANDHAAIFDRVEALAPGGRMSTEHSKRERQLERMGDDADEKLSVLDDEYFELGNSGRGLLKFAAAYITAHPDDFFTARAERP